MTQHQKKEPGFFRFFLEVFGLTAIILIAVQLLFTFVIAKDQVSGPSMEPNFHTGDHLITFRQGTIKRGSVIVFHPKGTPADTLYIKRIIGLPGDEVQEKNNTLYINGKKTAEPYLPKHPSVSPYTGNFSLQSLFQTKRVPKGYYFVMGDNRPVSKDSRIIGFIKKPSIKGIVRLRYWPLSNFQIYTN